MKQLREIMKNKWKIHLLFWRCASALVQQRRRTKSQTSSRLHKAPTRTRSLKRWANRAEIDETSWVQSAIGTRCFVRQLCFTFISQSPPGVEVAWIVDMSQPYKSSPQKTTHHDVAVGVFFGLICCNIILESGSGSTRIGSPRPRSHRAPPLQLCDLRMRNMQLGYHKNEPFKMLYAMNQINPGAI